MIVIAACRRFLLLPIEEKNSYRSLLSDLLSLSRDYPLGGTNVLFECFLFFPFSLRHPFRHLFRPEIHDIVNVICVSFRNRVGTESIFRPSLLSIGSIVKRVANEERRKTWVPVATRGGGGKGTQGAYVFGIWSPRGSLFSPQVLFRKRFHFARPAPDQPPASISTLVRPGRATGGSQVLRFPNMCFVLATEGLLYPPLTASSVG